VPRSSRGVAVFYRVLSPRCVASHRLNASSSPLAPIRGSTLRSFASRPFRRTKVDRESSREVMPSCRVLPACTVALALRRGDSFHGVRVPYSVVSARSLLPRACLTRYVPIPGFLNLLSACSSAHLAGLFHPADTPGISPFRAFSSRRSERLLDARFPLGIAFLRIDALGISIRRRLRLRPRFRRRRTCRLPSGPFSRLRARCQPHDVTRRGRSMLSWVFSLSRVFPPSAMARSSPRLLSCAFLWDLPGCPGSPTPAHFRVSLHRGGGCSLSRAPYPSEVSRLLFSHRFGKVRSGGIGFPRARAYVTIRAETLFGPFPFPCQSSM